jgi:hypothetical protein
MGLCLLLLQVGSGSGRLVRGLGGARAHSAWQGTIGVGRARPGGRCTGHDVWCRGGAARTGRRVAGRVWPGQSQGGRCVESGESGTVGLGERGRMKK